MSVIQNGSMQDVWNFIELKLKEHKEPYANLNAIYEFQILDGEEGIFQVEFANDQVFIYNQSEKEAVCTLKMKERNFRKFLLGELNSTTAFMTGKLKVDGNIGLALQLDGLLKKYDFTN